MPPSTSLHHPTSLSPLPHQPSNQYTRGCYGGSQPSMLNTATTTSPYTSPQLTKKGLIRQFFNSRPQLKATGGQGQPLSSAAAAHGPVTAEGPQRAQSAQDIKGSTAPSSPVSTPNPLPPSTATAATTATLPFVKKPPSSMPVTPQSVSRPSSPTARIARSPATPPPKQQQKSRSSLSNDDTSPLQRLLNKYPLNAAFLARYQVTAELGSGGFGHVLAATRIKDRKEVAVKLILKRRIPVSAWARDRELGVMPMEVYLVRRCNHPNVIAFEDFFEDERFGYLVMEMHGTQWSATDNAFIDEKDRKDAMHLAKAAEAARAQVDTIPEEIDPPEKKENEFISNGHHSPPSSPTAATATCRHPAIARVICEETGGAEQVSPSPPHRVRQLSNPTLSSTPAPRSLPSPPPMARTQSVPLPPKLARKPSMDLFECIEQNAHLPERHARHVFRQIAEAVAYLHSRGIVHRDLKDENIVIDSNLHVKIIDFGSAAFEPSHKKSQLFDRFQGTLQYASPEILRGERYKGRPSDIWAMGVLLYTMLHGECPFSSSEEAMASGYKPPKMQTSAECLQLVDWMLEKTPDRRPSAEQVLQHPWMRKVLP
ncbi:CAMK/CAMKL/PASK protein kinase [Spizellomyces punctatus DAOM BR117]|uniref:CAMK/CAMKL/PASK protein kinase n=1 Tax=Spizellomyces punctatus (strain DAOM BR117) TaxID=645134 RepID=A0A0L0HT29_SPIPD|nr:CAMK/CAMKL/PASK protein kinase [Spizellomyces punctatus DAOM BR117]KND04242.1 CAMK/CAMKL/PASK protein kinase [Spizellomyces punctatus DAOM BR117]|eukprot:XP_016612281.1 CAMK/CAMKL/PASK protein kinase [Spizellomyces punctatus DAOM BR117]